MPVVSVAILPDANEVQKALIARGIVDVIAEHLGSTRESVQVLFNEVAADELPGRDERDQPAFVSIRRQYIQPAKHGAYLDWRRDAVYTFMASHDGFISSTVLVGEQEPDQFVVITKWASAESLAAYRAKPRESELRDEVAAFHTQRPTDDFTGTVVPVFKREA
jgi:phenylpyruvate tautomerase PptA (4-oxalocrotonate tautomerase family)/heme-degrading monooxygenase HmoA